MPRPKGSPNKNRLNLTLLWSSKYTEDDIEKCYQTTIDMLNSDDPKHRMWAVEFIFNKFGVAAEKIIEAATEQKKIENKAEFDRLMKELADGHPNSTDAG